MTIYELQNLFAQYGLYVLAALVFWEYLSLPGVPGGIVLVLMGIMAGLGVFSIETALAGAFFSAMAGSVLIYLIGFIFPKPQMKFYGRRQTMKERFRLVDQYLKRYGKLALFRCRFHPVFRTFISIPAGILRMNFLDYLISSLLGNAIFVTMVVGAAFLITSLIV